VLTQLRQVYRHWGAGDWSRRFDFYDPDMEWGWSPEFPDIAGVYRDTETPNTRLLTWLWPWESWHCSAEDYIEFGDVIVVLTRYRGRGRGSGFELDTEGAHVWKFRDGKAVRLEVFADRAAALDSVRPRSARRPAAARQAGSG
jgi:ketosteroid isomerase-like protein